MHGSWKIEPGRLAAALLLGSLLALPALADDDADWFMPEEPKTLFEWRIGGEAEAPEEPEEDEIETDRPDFTEASSTVGLGRVQLEMGYTFTHDRSDGTSVDSHSYPETLLRVGLFREWFELRVGWNYGSEQLSGTGPTFTDGGSEDLYLGAKLALTEQKGWLPEMVLMPQMSVPTGSSSEILPGLNFLYGWDVTDFVSFAGSTQANRTPDGDHHYVEFAQSLTTGLSLTDKLGAYGEWYTLIPTGATSSEIKPEHYFNGGFTYKITSNLQLDWRAGVGLNKHSSDFFTGAGGAVRF